MAAIATGWTMNQVRQHTYRDVEAMRQAMDKLARERRLASKRK